MSAQALVRFQNVGKQFRNGNVALKPLSFTLGSGEFLALLGPSGCGKSTILRLLAGLAQPSAGIIEWTGGKSTNLGFVFQEATLMPWSNILANVMLPMRLTRTPRAEAEARALSALAQVGLQGFEHSRPRQLSGGMRMRVSIARALVTAPQILLMDEPFAALDEITRQRLNDDLLGLAADRGLTVIFVTHSVFESVYLADRILVMGPGRICAEIPVTAPAQRDAAYRGSAEYARQCAAVSAALAQAMAA